ncbi:hypothetical protein ScPMuIL_012538 [Solemya velum]
MAALFACTKCHVRQPFEELSHAEQLCKDCRNNFPIVKCTYCRAEFQQEEKGGVNSICKKCAHNVKIHGKPKACTYCSIIAAFIGSKCQRCAYSENKLGPPSTCEQCKQNCAFEYGAENKKKVGGKSLCWLCTQAYKRVMAKAHKRRTESQKDMGSRKSSIDNFDKLLEKEKVEKSKTVEKRDSSSGSSNSQQSTGSEKPEKSDKSQSSERTDKSDKTREDSSRANRKSKSFQSLSSSQDGSSPKKIRREQSNSNGMTPTKSGSLSIGLTTMEKNILDPNSSDHLIAMTQLQEQLEATKKQVTSKEQQLLEKDKKITELKALQYEYEKVHRSKIQSMQKMHSTAIENLQIKNRELLKQVKTLSKGKKLATIISSSSANNSASNSPCT